MLRLIASALFLTFIPVSNLLAQEQESYISDHLATLSSDEDMFILGETNNSLYEALSSAYENNPTVQAARAELRAVQEQLTQAQAGFQPTVSATADATHTDTDTKGTSFISSDGGNFSKSASVNLDQPLFKGGKTLAQIRKAKNTISAQQLSLSATEQEVLYQAALAYMDVLRDMAILKLNENNRNLVARELEQAQNRFTVGEITRTDVSQSEARLADADANSIAAKGNLRSAIAVYRRLVGEPPPLDMAYPAQKVPLPTTLEDVLSLAESNNRDVLQAKFINAAAEDEVDNRFGDMLPKISAKGSFTESRDPSDFIEEQRQSAIGLSASIPLYSGGLAVSRVREAKKVANQRYIQILEKQNNARQEALSNWEQLQASEAEVKARLAQIKASKIAQQGVHYETEFGERTTLDSLNANQELLDAQVNLVSAKRNEVVARFALARTLGLLVPQNLGFSTASP